MIESDKQEIKSF